MRGASATLRGWPVFNGARRLAVYMLAANVAAVLLSLLAVLSSQPAPTEWAKLGLLCAVALVFEEISRRTSRLQLRVGPDLNRDMTSVWGVAAAVALPLGMAAVLLGALGVYLWFRQSRPAGKALHRHCFNSANAILSSLAAGLALHALSQDSATSPWSVTIAAPIVVAIVVHTVVNRALASIALLLLHVPASELIGSLHDNLVELATLCLGGLVALTVLYEPWLAVLVIAPMVTLQRGALVRELETAATTDAKTGLYNAVTWERVAQRELTRALRTNASTAVMIVDLDRFKLVNDRFGHLAGDLVLRGVGQRLTAEVREYDTVGRFGGEEFVAVLPSASDADALVVAERLRSRIHSLRVSDFVDDVHPEDDASLAISIGVATTPNDGTELTELLYAADAALYEAKALGRNRVRLAGRGTGGSRRRLFAS